jgi:hypothetical protein
LGLVSKFAGMCPIKRFCVAIQLSSLNNIKGEKK